MTVDADERQMIRTSLRHVLDSTAAIDVPAALMAGGWAELVDVDPAVAISLLGEEAGRARSGAPVVELAVLRGAGIAPDASTAVIVDGLALAGAERAARFVCLDGDAITAIDAELVTLSPAGGFDPALALSTVDFDRRRAESIAGADALERAVAAGRRALASQIVGAVQQMLTDTLAYVSERHQYGRAIGSFQTVKHRLADVRVAATAAEAGVRAAWEVIDTTDEAIVAIAAKCLAGRAQRLASTHCFQVHGGIAFTVEHGFQQWVRRGLLLDFLLGGHEQLTAELGRRLVAAGTVPRVPDLLINV